MWRYKKNELCAEPQATPKTVEQELLNSTRDKQDA